MGVGSKKNVALERGRTMRSGVAGGIDTLNVSPQAAVANAKRTSAANLIALQERRRARSGRSKHHTNPRDEGTRGFACWCGCKMQVFGLRRPEFCTVAVPVFMGCGPVQVCRGHAYDRPRQRSDGGLTERVN
jgi:hypothetical protein